MQASGTSASYYGTSGGYYTSTSTFPSSYSSIDPPSFTQSGSYSGYIGSPPASSYVGDTGSSYYGTAPVNSSQAVSPLYQATGAFTLNYDGGSQADGAQLSDDVGSGVTLKVSNPSKPIRSITWTVGGADQSISASQDSGTTEVPLRSPQTNAPISNFQGQQEGNFGFYWNAQPGTDTVKAAVNFTDNTTASKTLTVKVNAPKLISFTRTYQAMGLATTKDDVPGTEGNPVVGMTQATTNSFGAIQTAGNRFAAQVNGSQLVVGGRIFMQQTVADDSTLTFNKPVTDGGVTGNVYETTNTVAVKNSQGQVTGYKLTPTVPMLDASLAYNNRYAAAPAGKNSDVWAASDSPTITFGGSSPAGYVSKPQGYYVIDATRKATFVSTLMYQSFTGAPVPVAKINWSIGSRATFLTNIQQPAGYYQSTTSWWLTSQTPTSGGVDQGAATNAFPTWTGSTTTTFKTILQPKSTPR